MALEIVKINESTRSVELLETIWLSADRDEALPDGHPNAAFLLGTAGKRIPLEEAERLGLTKGAKTKEIDLTPATKESAPEGDKAASPEADKQAQPETIRSLKARIGEMSDEELEALRSDERPGVQKLLEKALAGR